MKMDNWTKAALLLVGLLFLIALIFIPSNLDITFSEYFYQDGCWCRGDGNPLWNFLYNFGIFVAIIMGVLSLIAFCISYWNPQKITWRKPALLVLLTLIVGPGLLVNMLLKDNWGRSRPRNIVEFNGNYQYTDAFVISDTPDKSFSCGHCSMAFMLGIPFLFLRKRRKGLAYTFLGIGIFYGILMSVQRILVGGHFLSDALVSGVIVWLVGILISKWIKVDMPPTLLTTSDKNYTLKKRIQKTTSLGIPILGLALLTGTPYISHKNQLLEVFPSENKLVVNIEGNCDLILKASDNISFKTDVTSFGVPTSKVFRKIKLQNDTLSIRYKKAGLFTYNDIDTELGLPLSSVKEIHFSANKGTLDLEFPNTYGYMVTSIIDEHQKIITKEGKETIPILFSVKEGTFTP